VGECNLEQAPVGSGSSQWRPSEIESRVTLWPCLDLVFFYFDNIVFLFLFDKYSPIIEYLGLKDLSHDL
jgi:hypothetical protein